MRRLLVPLFLVLSLLAGCVTPPSGDVEGLATGALHWAEAALVSEHDHTDPSLHANLSTPNFQILGHAPLISEEYGTTVHGNLCGDAGETRDGRRLAVVETRGDVAFSIVDVTDSATPQWLGELVMRTTYIYDLALVPDGKHVVLVTSQHKAPERGPVLGSGLEWRSPCAPGGMAQWHDVPPAAAVAPAAVDALLPRPMSILLVDISDPAAPTIVDQRPLGGYGHGVSAADMDGRLVVAAAALGCVPRVGCQSHAQSFHFYEVVEGPLGGRLETLSVYTLPLEDEVMRVGHNDAWIAKHPVTEQWLAYLVAWDHGLLILDVDDPRNPELIGRFTDHDPSKPADDTGNFHSVHAVREAWDGRHYTVVGPEIIGHPSELPTGIVRVLDTTDPANPVEVGAWTLPHDVVWEERLHWSTHYLTVAGRTAFVSMYHGGVWALDLSNLTQEWRLLDAVGAFLPVGVSPAPPQNPFRWTPTLEEVHAFADGTLVTFDSNSGLYSFTFDEAMPMDPPAPWPVEKA